MKMHSVLKTIPAYQKNEFSDTQRCARTTVKKESVGSKNVVLLNMRKIQTKTVMLNILSQIMKKK